MIAEICEKVSKYLPSFSIVKDGKTYLDRFYFLLKDREFGNIFLHHFLSSDMDIGTDGFGLLHSHPWWGVSFILTGGYWEERRNEDGTVSRRKVKPFTFNFLRHNDFHRVDLIDEKNGAWTIFITGSRSKKREWCFWDRITKEFIDWKKVDGAIE